MRKGIAFYLVAMLIGICCLAANFVFVGDDDKALGGVLIGVGAGLIGMSVSGFIMKRMEYKHPELEKQNVIEFQDERNTMIRNRAKAKAGDITQWLIMVIAYLTILLSLPLWVTLAVVAVFAFYNACGFYLMGKYQKEM
ncbi:hypothetical protein [Gorillibacterium sp. CAU 1737]|uniref:hypothetical protein n=1 Tax=Gorillibacterium sp. CAU 1737 TaxID=3140362 RepID=UPI0032618BF9